MSARVDWYAQVQKAPAIVWVDGRPHLTRRDDVVAAATRPRIFARPPLALFGELPLPMPPLSCPPNEHGRYRRALRPLFAPDAVADLVPVLQDRAAELIIRVAANGSCDAMAEVAALFPAQALLAFMGFPQEDCGLLIQLRTAIRKASNRGTPAPQPVQDLLGYLAERLSSERLRPHGRDVLQVVAQQFSYAEALGFYALLVIAGMDNVTTAIGFALLELACKPQLRALLRAEPDQMAAFVDEIIRIEPPVSAIPRVTTQAVNIGGEILPAGTYLELMLGAPNMTGGVDVQIEGGKVRRQRSFSFGVGPRHCLGIHLVRLELKILLTEWLHRIPDFAPVPGFDAVSRPDTLAALPLQWEAKA
ncbi:hypothetical protein A5624_08570 [Mycobacterium sp. 1482292.6]|nr:hypothetical protein A5624_08570 [Mycobacterium sp. 1482292.6]